MTLSNAIRRTKLTRRGLTLIEAMATTAILGVGLAGAAKLTAFISDRLAYNRNYANASALAEQVMEEVRTYGCAPNAETDACGRLFEHYMHNNDDNNPKLYCWPTKGTPIELGENADCEGTLFQARIYVTTMNHTTDDDPPFDRTYKSGTTDTPISLANVANVRVTIRWNDVHLDGTTGGLNRPMFVVYQTRVTQ